MHTILKNCNSALWYWFIIFDTLSSFLLHKIKTWHKKWVIFLTENDVIERIKFLLEFNHWSVYKLAKQSSIPYSNLNNIFNRNTCPSIPTLQKICNGFQISLSEFFDFQTNPLRLDTITEDEQNIINSYNSLSSTDKKLLKAYLRGLCKK